ncbi:hypothetical protein DMC47_02850 [Nostoc sp. 3335mG]|nr:hypothetical protein DMC47_02850 [Nostoc sp. 3335mG]
MHAYFSTVDEWAIGKSTLGLFSIEESIDWTNQFLAFHPMVRHLQGIILDDPGTSDHHASLCRDPFKGAVMYLAHDGESRIVFDGMDSFLKAARDAAERKEAVYEQHPKRSWIVNDQAALKDLITSLQSGADGEDIVPALVPSLDLSDTDFLATLVSGHDLYVPEAVGREIAARPTPPLMAIAKLCEEHRHPVVRNAGAIARERIANL